MARSDIQKLYTTDPVVILACSDKAAKVQRDDEEPVWLPFSLIIEPEEKEIVAAVGDPAGTEITIPEWLAREKGFF